MGEHPNDTPDYPGDDDAAWKRACLHLAGAWSRCEPGQLPDAGAVRDDDDDGEPAEHIVMDADLRVVAFLALEWCDDGALFVWQDSEISKTATGISRRRRR